MILKNKKLMSRTRIRTVKTEPPKSANEITPLTRMPLAHKQVRGSG